MYRLAFLIVLAIENVSIHLNKFTQKRIKVIG